MITCKFCGNENNDGATTCYICGKSLMAGRVNSLVGIGDQQYHGINDSLPYGANLQNATRFQSDTGGGAHSGPTQQTFGAQMLSGQTTEKKSNTAVTVLLSILMLAIAAALIWYFCFSSHAVIHLNLPGSAALKELNFFSKQRGIII